MPTYAQLFCTVSDVLADKQASGVDETRMYQAIREASDYVQKKIGWFIPVTLTRYFEGANTKVLFVNPLLAITSLTHGGTALSAADYSLQPDGGFWANGPYTRLHADPDSTLLSCWIDEQDAIVIAGRWGNYERTGLLGATVQDAGGQTASQTTLQVSDGSKVSAGMVVLIETEQQAVTGWGSPTTNVTTLNGAVTNTQETLTLANGSLVNAGEVIRVEFEQMKVKDKQNNLLSVIRGWNGTAKVTHANASAVDVYRTVNVERGVNGTTSAAHAKDTAMSRYFVPDDIQFLTKEIATLSINKAQSGYQGRTGNTEMGTIFYNDAFPRYDIEMIASNYRIPKI